MGLHERKMALVSSAPFSEKYTRFKDSNFQANNLSLGLLNTEGGKISWKPLAEICRSQDMTPCIFKTQPTYTSILQGRLGDCWLLSALACLCCQRNGLENLFRKRKISKKGRYSLLLYNCDLGKWVDVEIDDWLPCDEETSKLVFARTSDGSAWLPLLEKAIAKLQSSYASLHGGDTAWALRTLTGKPCFKFRYSAIFGRWRRFELVYSRQERCFRLAKTRCFVDSSAMFRMVQRKHVGGALIAASSGQCLKSLMPDSIIRPGHAYAVLSVLEARGTRLLKLWVPAREAGAHFLGCHQLNQPHLTGLNKLGNKQDGTFWIPWTTFCQYFYTLEFCSDDTS